MLTRFRTNVVLYPRLFRILLVGCILALVEIYIPVLVGIDARQVMHVNLVDLTLAFVLSVPIYLWVTTKHTTILLDILTRFEGRDVCTVAEHNIDDEETFEEEPPQYEEEVQ